MALTLHPTLAAAHFSLGNLHALRENFTEAQLHFRHATEFAPHLAVSHFALGFTHNKLGRHAEAIASYTAAIRLCPTFASAWLNLGVSLIADGQSHLAPHCYQQALATSPSSHPSSTGTRISAHLNLGHYARTHRNLARSQHHYETALALAQNLPGRLPEIHVAFTYLHLEQSQFPQAWQSLRQATLTQGPMAPNPEIPNAQGILLIAEQTSQEQTSEEQTSRKQPWVPHVSTLRHGILSSGTALIHEAIQSFQQAEDLGLKTAPSNRGNALLRLGRVEEALAAHHQAVIRDPHHPGARYNLALTQLRLGDFHNGWQNYESRWQFREIHPHPRRFSQPRWQGQPLPSGSTLLLYSEQGLGDTLQFLRYLELVHHRTPGTKLILEVQPQLTRLLSDIPGVAIHPHGQPLPPFTHHHPRLSLPALFQTTPKTIPAQIPYLQPNPQLAQTRGRELATLNRNPRIGLNWAGNPRYRADHERSTTLQTFLPLLELPRLNFISLQHGPPALQIQQIPEHLRPHDLSSADRDLADTAALIHHLDLVITTDTAIAHLAGALGKPLWLLLPWQSDWRWMQEIPTTPWYPAARLFRQPSPSNWPELIHQAAHELHLWQSSS
jgi:tetratricopeptide (TPR) repeat protein